MAKKSDKKDSSGQQSGGEPTQEQETKGLAPGNESPSAGKDSTPSEKQNVPGGESAKMPQGGNSVDQNLMEEIYTGDIERLFTESAMHPDSLRRPYNPDPLVMRDWTYRVYEEMLEDDQINIALQIKKDLVVGSGYYFETESEDQEDIKKDLEICFGEQTDRPFSEILVDMLQAYEYGFSISEKLFKKRADGSIFLRDVKPRHPSTWLLHTDPHGNVDRYEQRGLHDSVDAEPNSIIHYVNNSKHQNPYGRSDLFPAFQAYMTKRHITRFYAIFLEKAASPTPVAKYDRRADQGAINDVFEALKKFQTKTAITIPKEFDIEFLEAKSTGEAFLKGINLFNMFIGRALFIPDLLGFQGAETGGGSHALGEHQIGMFLRHIYRRREIVERVVNQHFVRPICTYNFGMTEDFPKFKFNPLSDDDAHKQAELWIKAMQGKNWEPTIEEVNHLRSLIKFPQSDILTIPQAVNPLDPNADPNSDPNNPAAAGGEDNPGGDEKGGNPKEAGPGDNKEGGKEAIPGKAAGKPAGKTIGKEKGKAQPPAKAPVKKKFEFDISGLKGPWAKRVDFQAVDNVLKTTVSNILRDAQPITHEIFEDLYDQAQKKKIIQNQNLEKAETIQPKYLKRLQLVFKMHFRRAYKDGQGAAKHELSGQKYAQDNIPSDEFLDFLDQETFKYIGDWSYTVTKKLKDELIKAIKDGRPLSDVIGVMDDEGLNLSDVSLERFARTKTTEVFNRGRLEHFNSTGIVEAYQYAAVLDDRTSDICEGLDGCIFEKEDAPVPPLHFNCRSVLLPITKYEDYEADEKANNGDDIDDFIEENIGKGFPVN